MGWAAIPDTTTQPAAAAGSTAEAGGADRRRGAASRVAWRRADHDASAYYRDMPLLLRRALVSSLRLEPLTRSGYSGAGSSP